MHNFYSAIQNKFVYFLEHKSKFYLYYNKFCKYYLNAAPQKIIDITLIKEVIHGY